jgi:hypothetical protein
MDKVFISGEAPKRPESRHIICLSLASQCLILCIPVDLRARHAPVRRRTPSRPHLTAIMPVRSRAADLRIKQAPTPLDVSVSTPKACKQEIADLDELVRVCDVVDHDSPIFSTVGSPDDVDSTTGDELGDYELSYLHNLYQGDMEDVAILPETDAPPSLGPASGLRASALSALCLKQPASGMSSDSQAETPPVGDHGSWDDTDETSSRCASPVPSGPALKASPGTKSGAISRKRKAAAVERETVVSPSKAARSAANKMRACSPVDVDSPSSSRSSSECPSNRPMLDGMEIRPEDDPLGLFSRDPATLTAEEQRLLKKQRRLLKNRESAQLSRHRKKCHLHTLEKQVDALKKEKAVLQQKVQELVEENERLRKGE